MKTLMTRLTIRRLPLAGLLLGLLLSAHAAHADIAIGLAGPATGTSAFMGEQMQHGVAQAITDINQAGGVNGQKLALTFMDDACDPRQAVAVANKMISQGIKFVVGHGCSGSSIPAARVYNDEQIFMISPVSSNPALTDAGYQTVFRTYGRDDQQGAFIAHEIEQHDKDRKLAIIDDKSAWGRGIVDEIRKNFAHDGFKEAMDVSYNAGDRDFSALINRMKQDNVTLAFVAGDPASVGLIVRQIAAQKAGIQVMGGDAMVTDEFWSVTGPAGEGTLMSYSADPRQRPEAQAALTALRKSGFEPEGYTLNSYAAVQVIAEGIRRAGTDPVKVAAALRAQPVATVIGPISYDAHGDMIDPAFAMYRWHDGHYTAVKE